MELVKKTTILFSPELHAHLTRVASQRGISLGELVRSACEQVYGRVSPEDRLRAVEALGSMNLPVGTPDELERESVPEAQDDSP